MNRSVSSAPSVQEADSPSKELEQQMWMDRVHDSAKGSTSSSSSRSSVQSPARLAKPHKPAPILAGKRFVDGNAVATNAGARGNTWQSSVIDKEDATQLHSVELDTESDVDSLLRNTRKLLAAGDIRNAHKILQKVSLVMKLIHARPKAYSSCIRS